jgi:hypothetical protein
LQLFRREAHVFAELTRTNPIFALTYSRYVNYPSFAGKHPAKTPVYDKAMTRIAREWAEITRQPKVLDHLLRPEMIRTYKAWTLRMNNLEARALEGMSDHPHPLVALDAGVYLARSKVNKADASEDARLQAFQEARKAYEKALAASTQLKEHAQQDDFRAEVYVSWRQSIQSWRMGSENIIRESTALCDAMLDRKDLNREVLLWIRPRPPFLGPTPEERWRLLRKAIAVVDGSPKRDEPALRQVRHTLLQYRDMILKLDPKLAASDPKLARESLEGNLVGPWKARLLVRLKDVPGMGTLRQPFLYKGQLYCLAVAGDLRTRASQATIHLLRIPLEQGKPELLGECRAGLDTTLVRPLASAIQCACVGENTVYVGTRDDGVLAFPLSGGPGRNLALELPSSRIKALAYLDGKLFAYGEGGYLVEIDPQKREFRTLASSRRKDRLSPFDDAEPFDIPFLTADAARQRLLFLLIQPAPKGASFKSKGANGFWAFDLKTGRFSRLLETIARVDRFTYPQLLRFGTPIEDGKMLLSSAFATVEFDVVKDKARLLRCVARSPVPALKPDSAVIRTQENSFGVAYLQDQNGLWSLSGVSVVRLSLDGRLESFAALGPGIPRLWSPDAGYLQRLGPNEILVGGSEGFAALRLDKEEASGKSPR